MTVLSSPRPSSPSRGVSEPPRSESAVRSAFAACAGGTRDQQRLRHDIQAGIITVRQNQQHDRCPGGPGGRTERSGPFKRPCATVEFHRVGRYGEPGRGAKSTIQSWPALPSNSGASGATVVPVAVPKPADHSSTPRRRRIPGHCQTTLTIQVPRITVESGTSGLSLSRSRCQNQPTIQAFPASPSNSGADGGPGGRAKNQPTIQPSPRRQRNP